MYAHALTLHCPNGAPRKSNQIVNSSGYGAPQRLKHSSALWLFLGIVHAPPAGLHAWSPREAQICMLIDFGLLVQRGSNIKPSRPFCIEEDS
jgi:hypothetical protein